MPSQTPDRAAPTAGNGGGARAALPRSVVVLLVVVGVVALGAGIRAAAEIVAPTMLALVLTIAVLPVGPWCRRHGWPGWLATLTALATAYLIVLSLIVGSIICLIRLIDVLPEYAGDAQQITDNVDKWLSSIGLSSDSTSNALQKVDPAKVATASRTCCRRSSAPSAGCSSW